MAAPKGIQDKSENGIMKCLGWLIAAALLVLVTVAVICHSRIIYGLIFLIALIAFVLAFWKMNLLFKIMDVFLLVYSPLVLTGVVDKIVSGGIRAETLGDNVIIAVLIGLAEIFAISSARIVIVVVAFACVMGRMMWGNAWERLWINLQNQIHGPLPQVHSLVDGNKKIVLRRNYGTGKYELIYRNNRHKKIICEYEYTPQKLYSLSWRDKNNVVVIEYNSVTREIINEQIIQISGKKK